MIKVNKLNQEDVFINPDLLRAIEQTPDTLLTFTDGTKLIVRERPAEIIERIVAFRMSYQNPLLKDTPWI